MDEIVRFSAENGLGTDQTENLCGESNEIQVEKILQDFDDDVTGEVSSCQPFRPPRMSSSGHSSSHITDLSFDFPEDTCNQVVNNGPTRLRLKVNPVFSQNDAIESGDRCASQKIAPTNFQCSRESVGSSGGWVSRKNSTRKEGTTVLTDGDDEYDELIDLCNRP